MHGDFPAKNTVYTYIYLIPTFITCMVLANPTYETFPWRLMTFRAGLALVWLPLYNALK